MIDWSRVEELHGEVGDEDFAEIVELFLEELQESVESLGGSGSVPNLSETLHSIKGSAANLGFHAVSEICAAGERDPKTFDHATLRTSVFTSIEALTERYKAIL